MKAHGWVNELHARFGHVGVCDDEGVVATHERLEKREADNKKLNHGGEAVGEVLRNPIKPTAFRAARKRVFVTRPDGPSRRLEVMRIQRTDDAVIRVR